MQAHLHALLCSVLQLEPLQHKCHLSTREDRLLHPLSLLVLLKLHHRVEDFLARQRPVQQQAWEHNQKVYLADRIRPLSQQWQARVFLTPILLHRQAEASLANQPVRPLHRPILQPQVFSVDQLNQPLPPAWLQASLIPHSRWRGDSHSLHQQPTHRVCSISQPPMVLKI